jgi:hypothetical protein
MVASGMKRSSLALCFVALAGCPSSIEVTCNVSEDCPLSLPRCDTARRTCTAETTGAIDAGAGGGTAENDAGATGDGGEIRAPSSARSSLSVTPDALEADGASVAQVRLVLRDSTGMPLENEVVSLSTNLSTLTPFTGRTGPGGIFTAELKSGSTPAANSMVTAVLSNGQTLSSMYSLYATPTWSTFVAVGLAPSPRTGHAMAYAGSGQVLLFGGYGDNNAVGDTWLWNGGSWRRKPDAPTSLGLRFGHSMAYNSDSGEVLLYDGEVDRPSELWKYKDEQWSPVKFGGASPTGRSTAGWIYQPNRKRFLLFGGSARGFTRSDAWEFDPATLTWEPVTANLLTPPGRRDFGMAYDTSRNTALVFGGTGGGQGTEVILGDTWGFSSGTWSKVATAPMPASGAPMVFDAYRNRMVLFGGFAGGNLPRVSSTWEFGSQWVFRPTSLTPSGRSGHSMAYDVERKKVVMFGGSDGTNMVPNTVFEYGP